MEKPTRLMLCLTIPIILAVASSFWWIAISIGKAFLKRRTSKENE